MDGNAFLKSKAMTKFFRKIRQSLLGQSKFKAYLLYAVGEIVLVVIGILLAIQINNWNEQRKSNIVKNDLIVSLIGDFTSTQALLSESIKASDAMVEENAQLLELIGTRDLTIDQVRDIRGLMSSFLRGTSFRPNLSVYKAAQANGQLRLIESNRLLELFTAYDNSVKSFQLHDELSGQNFYLGSIYELHKMVGAISALRKTEPSADAFQLSDQELMKLLRKKDVFAALENTAVLNSNLNRNLHFVQKTIDDILLELEALIK